MRRSTRIVFASAVLSGVTFALVACIGDSPQTQSTLDGSSPDFDGAPSSTPDSSEPADAGADVETITEGGANLDPDAGEEDLDASIPPDAGVVLDGGAIACNATALTAAAVNTTCATFITVPSGGALVAGTYQLKGITVLGSSSFCSGTFVPSPTKGALVLTVAGGVGTAQRATIFGTTQTSPTRRSETLTPGGGNGTPLTLTTSCPSNIAQRSVPYSSYASSTGGGRPVQHLVLRLPYGRTGEALYSYEK
jgi:hypothetical protein